MKICNWLDVGYIIIIEDYEDFIFRDEIKEEWNKYIKKQLK